MSSRRAYRSDLREERARETRRRLRRSARDLFVERGVSGTTIAAIAERAGVSSQTVYATYGSKSAIIVALIDEMEEGAGNEGWTARLLAEADPYRRLRLFAGLNRTLFEASTDVLRVAMEARSDPDVRAFIALGDGRRRNGTQTLCEGFDAQGVLARDLSVEGAAERLWLLTSVEQYLLAVDALGWTPEAYEDWLGDLLERELLAPRSA
jgi:AcrR family transcriptional regulator